MIEGECWGMVFLYNHSHLLSHWSCDFVAYLMCTHLLTPSVSALLDCASCLLVLCSGWLRLDTSSALHLHISSMACFALYDSACVPLADMYDSLYAPV